MGALPSQKYDFVLESFIEYLKENYTTVGYNQGDTNDYWIDSFLTACDNKEWELWKNTRFVALTVDQQLGNGNGYWNSNWY